MTWKLEWVFTEENTQYYYEEFFEDYHEAYEAQCTVKSDNRDSFLFDVFLSEV